MAYLHWYLDKEIQIKSFFNEDYFGIQFAFIELFLSRNKWTATLYRRCFRRLWDYTVFFFFAQACPLLALSIQALSTAHDSWHPLGTSWQDGYLLFTLNQSTAASKFSPQYIRMPEIFHPNLLPTIPHTSTSLQLGEERICLGLQLYASSILDSYTFSKPQLNNFFMET